MVNNAPASTEGLGSIPGSGRFPGVGNGHQLQFSCLENSMDRGGLVGYSPSGCKVSDMTEPRCTYTHISLKCPDH